MVLRHKLPIFFSKVMIVRAKKDFCFRFDDSKIRKFDNLKIRRFENSDLFAAGFAVVGVFTNSMFDINTKNFSNGGVFTNRKFDVNKI